MSKATEQNDKLKRAIIISAVLHVILFAALIWSSFDEHIDASAGGGGGSSIDAVMVDPGAVVQQYNRQQQQQASAKRAEEQREKQAQQQAEELREKQAAEQERLKQLEKERLQAQEQARRVKEATRQSGMVAPDIRHEGPSISRDASLASTAYKDITISLFDSKVNKDTLSDIADALAGIPDLLLDKFSGTIYIVSDIRNVAANASADAIGMFLTTGDIYIEAWSGHEDTYVRTLAHELGHNLDWKLGLSAGYGTFMTASDSDWIALWEEYPTYQSQEGSLYSTVSIQEWFAEIIADYVCYPNYEEEYYPELYGAIDAFC